MKKWNVAFAAIAVTVPLAACAPEAPGGGSSIPAGCYDSPNEAVPDLRYSGVANTHDNLRVALDIASFTLSENGTCAGVPLEAPYAFTLVRAADAEAAQVRCTTLGFDEGVGQLDADYPTFPSDAWVCNPISEA